jgi:hypothetical protein
MQLKHTLSSEGRAWVGEVWAAADGLCSKPLISPTLIKLGPRLCDRYAAAENVEGEEIREAFFSVVTAGYASRGVLAGPTEQPGLDISSLPLPSNPQYEEAAMAEVESVASDNFESVMTLPKELWAAYLSLAVMHLQERLTSSTLSWYQLSAQRIETMLRHGYLLRCLDESLERTPA